MPGNRKAQTGVFIFSASHSPPEIQPFTRIGKDIFILWNSEDPASDVYLQAALSLAKALCTQQANISDATEIDYDALEKAVLELSRQTDSLSEIKTFTETIAGSTEKILKRLRLKSILSQIEILDDHLHSLRLKGDE